MIDDDLFDDPAALNQAIEEKARVTRQAFRDTFTSTQGMVVLDYLKVKFYNTLSFVPDAYVTAYNEGQRALVHAILQMMERKDEPAPIEER